MEGQDTDSLVLLDLYNCVSFNCVEVSGSGGTYPTLLDCQTVCFPITQVLIYANDIGSVGAQLQYTRNGGAPIPVASVAGPGCGYVGAIFSGNVSVGDVLEFSTSSIVYAINGQLSASCPFASPSSCSYIVTVIAGTNNVGIKIDSNSPCA